MGFTIPKNDDDLGMAFAIGCAKLLPEKGALPHGC